LIAYTVCMSKTFLIVRRIQPDIIIKVRKPYFFRVQWNLNILEKFLIMFKYLFSLEPRCSIRTDKQV